MNLPFQNFCGFLFVFFKISLIFSVHCGMPKRLKIYKLGSQSGNCQSCAIMLVSTGSTESGTREKRLKMESQAVNNRLPCFAIQCHLDELKFFHLFGMHLSASAMQLCTLITSQFDSTALFYQIRCVNYSDGICGNNGSVLH